MKQVRSLVHLASSSCIIRDISFVEMVDIRNAHAELLPLVRAGAELGTRGECVAVELLDIGPAELYWAEEDRAWAFCHPLVGRLLRATLPSARGLAGCLNVFEIMGPRAGARIGEVLRPVAGSPDGVIAAVGGLCPPSSARRGFSLEWVASVGRLDGGAEGMMEGPIDLRLLGGNEWGDAADPDFNRSRARRLFPKSERAALAVPVLLLARESVSGFGASYVVVLPFGTGAEVFRAFTGVGMRPFGLEAARLIDLEAARFSYPFDRPETPAGREVLDAEWKEVCARDLRRPPGKRLHPRTFVLGENVTIGFADCAFARVQIEAIRRGTPARFDTLLAPEGEAIGLVLEGNNSLLCGAGRGIGLVDGRWLSEAGGADGRTWAPLRVVNHAGTRSEFAARVRAHVSNWFP